MHCPSCNSVRVRKASAVYMDGTQKTRTRIRGVGIGAGRRGGLGLGVFTGRGVSRGSTIAAEKADRARVIWIGPFKGLGLFILFSVIFAVLQLYDPFGKALGLAIAIMIGCPAATAVLAAVNNQDYDRRWYCDTCGEVWTSETPLSR